MATLDKLAGTLLGTALGDALGLATEGMSARAIARRFGRVEGYRLIGPTGYVSDDTEQAALVAQALARFPDDPEAGARAFRRSLLGWFCRLPWGVGRATVRSCARIALGLRPGGVMSAGNGAAMRAAILGTFLDDRPELRAAYGRALARVTHLDPRAVAGALYVADLAAACALGQAGQSPEVCQREARGRVDQPELAQALDKARGLALDGAGTAEAARALGSSGFVVHSAAFASYALIRHGPDPLLALTEVVNAGGDTDSNAAILGGWLGALHGEAALPRHLVDAIHDGPFGPTHLRALAACLARIREGDHPPVPGYSVGLALARNLALWPVILGHGLRRLLPC